MWDDRPAVPSFAARAFSSTLSFVTRPSGLRAGIFLQEQGLPERAIGKKCGTAAQGECLPQRAYGDLCAAL